MAIGVRNREGSGGGSLAFVLVVTTLAFLTAFVMAGSSSAHLSFANHSSRGLRARLLAEATLTRAVAELQNNVDWGNGGESLQVSLPGSPAEAFGRLTFLEEADQPHSTYNLSSDTSRPGFGGRLVPPHSVHLVAEGNCLGATRRLEAVVSLPPYPYAIASAGPIESDGELLVGSLSEPPSGAAITADDLAPAHLASNHPEENSVRLGPKTVVVGDVRSAGGVVLGQGALIKGQTLAYGQPVALPEVPLERYDPELSPSGYQTLPTELADTTLQGSARADGDLTVYGELNLQQAKLYVNGHLTVRGPISGDGLIVARQGATIYTGARIAGGQSVLLSGDDVQLRGGGPLGSFFYGMVYTEGGFDATDISVVGSFIARGEDAGVKLTNARVLGDSGATSWVPSSSHSFHFVPGQQSHEPAVQMAVPTQDSFAIVARVVLQNGRLEYQVDDPLSGQTRSYSSVQPAARAIATSANQMARQMVESGAQGTGRNLVSTARTLEETLQQLAQETQESAGQGFDLNQFLSIADRMRVTLWREM